MIFPLDSPSHNIYLACIPRGHPAQSPKRKTLTMARNATAEVEEIDIQDTRLPDQPNLSPNDNQRLISTYDVEFILPNVVSQGDTLTDLQAKFFNIQYHSFIVKAFAPTLKTMKDEGKSWNEINDAFQKHAADYEWRPRGDGTSLDPIEREMFSLARSIVNTRLSANGEQTLNAAVRSGTMTKESVEEYLAGVVQKNYPALREKVLRRRAEAAEAANQLEL